ncbi:MAG: lysophospholipid acyltransferase family protein [Lachnospiraceae bacterium]
MIRFLLTCIVVIGYLILSIPFLLGSAIWGKFNRQKKDEWALHCVQSAFRLCLKTSGIQVTVLGHENVPTNRPVLYICNHRSFFDIPLTYVQCPGLTGYIAKKEMESIPLLSNWMKYLYCLFLDRSNIKEGLKTILKAIEYIRNGISICIFPEGTRNKGASELEMLPFHDGSFKIATKSGCPIIPIAITNSSAIFEDHFPRIKPVKVIVEYGKPIYPEELDNEEKKFLGKYTQNIILEMLKKHSEMI